jgi:hypothetical protein
MPYFLTRTFTYMFSGRRERSVGIATGYRLEDRGSIPVRSKNFFPSPQLPHLLWAYKASSPMGAVGFSTGDKADGE